ncbi:MAG: hypothetical protein IPP69_17635 [Flavobacteriales bacterium]|nr:hypothetical protein [Flavobacteriales bacterium]
MTRQDLIEKLNSDYTRCSALNIPAVSSRLFYPIYESVIGDGPHLKEGEFIESIGDNFIVGIFGVGKFRDKADKFFVLNDL